MMPVGIHRAVWFVQQVTETPHSLGCLAFQAALKEAGVQLNLSVIARTNPGGEFYISHVGKWHGGGRI